MYDQIMHKPDFADKTLTSSTEDFSKFKVTKGGLSVMAKSSVQEINKNS